MPSGTRCLLLACAVALPCGAAAAELVATSSLADLSLEELGNLQITSVSKRAERLADAAASVFVITGEDIRRSGARSLPEALRLAPNLHVAQASASDYAISARGFNSSSANKLLVLINGRSVYTPLFSGVFWDVQDVLLEDVERIEVISGPGGTLWGVNAVNGVINVITRSSADTQGSLLAAGAGNRDRDLALRYGGRLGERGSYRVYAKYFDRLRTKTADGSAKDDAWHKTQVGFRTDWRDAADTWTVNANAYEGREGQPLPGTIAIQGVTLPLGTISVSGANITGRWIRALDGGSELSVLAYVDHTERVVPPTFSERLTIFDLQVQHSLGPLGIHRPVWGAEYRYGRDRVENGDFLAFDPPRPFFGFVPERVDQDWWSIFAQDEMRLRPDLRLTIGARLERNDYTGLEFLPSARLAWTVAPDHLLWAAASRAVRAPSRLDRDVFVPERPPFLLAGGPNVRAEVAKVFEIGYRGRPTNRFSYSATVFHTLYDHLRTQEIAPSGTFLVFDSRMEGRSTGLETWGSYQAAPNWRLSGGYSWLRERLRLKPDSTDFIGREAQEGSDPSHMWLLRSSVDLPLRTEFDLTVRHVAALSDPEVPSYTTVDIRLGWKPRPDLELSVSGRNLFDGGHGEFADRATRTEVGRDVFFKAAVRF